MASPKGHSHSSFLRGHPANGRSPNPLFVLVTLLILPQLVGGLRALGPAHFSDITSQTPPCTIPTFSALLSSLRAFALTHPLPATLFPQDSRTMLGSLLLLLVKGHLFHPFLPCQVKRPPLLPNPPLFHNPIFFSAFPQS